MSVSSAQTTVTDHLTTHAHIHPILSLLAKGAQKRRRGLFLSHATRPLKSNTIAEIQATIWQCNLLWKERKSIILYIKAGFLILGNDFGLCKACSIYLLPENDPGTNNVFNLSASFNPGLIRLASLRGFILETVVFSVKRQRPDVSSWGRRLNS